ncbi:ABC transporter ATP-binding protein [Candidatus Sumerlaeota bacterium]|nr:ABC transporter ATP-binding protein [Candidatus Sumerlaeota bacterium]
MEPVIQFLEVRKYFGKLRAVDGLSFDVPRSSLYGFLGPNGSGKSTTLSMLAGFARPTAGRILLFGENNRDHRLRERVGLMIEEPAFYGYLSARKNLELAGRLYTRQPDGRRIDETLELVGLEGRGKDLVKNFSHGMKQRLGLAQAYLHQPELLILDEPSNGLDPEGNEEMWRILVRLVSESGCTILVSSHLLYEVEEFCTHLSLIKSGRLIADGEVKALLEKEDLQLDVGFVSENEQRRALELLQTQEWIGEALSGGKLHAYELRVHIGREPVERLTGWLREQSLQTTTIVPVRRTLRDLFMALTASASKSEGREAKAAANQQERKSA